MGIENAKHLGEMLLGMADQNLYTGGDYDTVILNLRKNQIDLASEIAEMQEKKKGFVYKSLRELHLHGVLAPPCRSFSSTLPHESTKAFIMNMHGNCCDIFIWRF